MQDDILREELARLLGTSGEPEAGDALDALWIARLSGLAPVDWSLVGNGEDPTAAPPTADPPPTPTDPDPGQLPGPPQPSAQLHLTGGGNGSALARPGRAHTVRVPQPRAISDALSLNRALRPLRQLVASTRVRTLDVQATAAASGDSGLLLPVLRPAIERRFSVDLLIDTGATMTVWHRLACELRALLTRHGAFADVRAWALHTDGPEPRLAPFRRGAQAASPTRRWKQNLADPTGRRAVLILTDGVGPAWYGTELTPALADWSRERPVAALQVLPSRLWHRTALRTSPVRARGTEAARATIEVRSSGRVPGITRGRAGAADRARVRWLPVLEVSGPWLHPWARLVSGRTTDWTPLQAAPLTVAARPRPAGPYAEPTTPATWIAHFEEGYSPEAFRLLRLLAAAPLSLPVMRLVQRSMLPESTPMHLAEVFLSGLLVRRTPARTGEDPDSVLYDFRDGVRESLLSRLTRTESLRVLRGVIKGVSKRVEATFGGVTDFQALVAAAGTTGGLDGLELPEDSQAFAEVALAVIRGTGGDYAEVAARLVDGVGAPVVESTIDQAELMADEAESGPVGRERGAWRRLVEPRLDRFRFAWGQAIPNESPLPSGDDGTARVPSRIPELPDHHERRGLTYSVLEVLRRGSPRAVKRYPVSGPTVCVVEGTPGVGKTSLAIDCARELEAEFGLVRWIRADSTESLGEDLMDLAAELGVAREPNIFSGLRAYLINHPGWLLIYDGVTLETTSWIPDGRYGSLLVTVSEGIEWPLDLHETVTLDDFSRESALRYVEKALPRGELWGERNDLLDLLEVTGTHPRALAEAVSRIESDHRPVTAYVMAELVRRAEVARFLPLLVWITRNGVFLGLGVAVKPDVVVTTAVEGLIGEFRVQQVDVRDVRVVRVEPSGVSGLTLLTLSEAVLSPATLADPDSAPAVAVWGSPPTANLGPPAFRLRPITPGTRPLPPNAALVDADGRLCSLVTKSVDRAEAIAVTPQRLFRSARVKQQVPLFYLSHAPGPSASGTRDNRLVAEFVNDLTTALVDLTGLGSAGVTYFSLHESVPSGVDWQEVSKRALARAQVFVPLYSPSYFRSAWCGREWGAFNLRQQRQSVLSTRSAIVPVLWDHIDPEQLPPVVRSLQYTAGDIGEGHVPEGFYGLLASRRPSAYRRAVHQLATAIADVATTTRLRPCDPSLFDNVPNAFEADES